MSTDSDGGAFGACLKKLRGKKNLKLNEVGIKLEIDPTLLSSMKQARDSRRKTDLIE